MTARVATRNHCFWCADHRSEIEEWRATLAQSERNTINHPTVMRRRYDAAHKIAAKEAPKKETPREALVQARAELARTSRKNMR